MPRDPAELVELGILGLSAVTGQQLDIFHRQVEFGPSGILKLDTIVGGVLYRQCLQADKARQTMIGMDDKITGSQTAGFHDYIGCLLALARSRQAIPQNVLFGNNDEIVGFKTAFDRQHNPTNFRSGGRVVPVV